MANRSSKTFAPFNFSRSVRGRLARMLPVARQLKRPTEAAERLERMAANFHRKILFYGYAPSIECWSQATSNAAYSPRVVPEANSFRESDCVQRWKMVGQADELLRELCVDVAECWRRETGRVLPRVNREHLVQSVTNLGRGRAGLAREHPLWLVIEATGLRLSATAVDDLVRYALREVRRKRTGISLRKERPANAAGTV